MNVDAYIEMIENTQDDISYKIDKMYELKNKLSSVMNEYISHIDEARELVEEEIDSWGEIVSGRLTAEDMDYCDDLYLATKRFQEELSELIDNIDKIDDLL